MYLGIHGLFFSASLDQELGALFAGNKGSWRDFPILNASHFKTP